MLFVYLGYLKDQQGIRPNPENVESVKSDPIPKNVKDVQSFLGLVSYFRRFIPSFSISVSWLYDLLKKKAKFQFGESELNAFEQLREKLL